MSYGAVPTATNDHPYAGEHILTSKESGKVVTFRNDTRVVNGSSTVVHSVMLHDDVFSNRPRICLEPASDPGRYKLIQKRFYNIDANDVASYMEKYVKFDDTDNIQSIDVSAGNALDSTWEVAVTENGDGSSQYIETHNRKYFAIDETVGLNFTTTNDNFDVKNEFVLKRVHDPSLAFKYESSTLSLSESEWTNITVTIDPIARKLEYHKNGKLIDSLKLMPGQYASLMKSVYVGRDPTDLLYRNDSIEKVQVFAEKLSPNAIGSLAETRDFDVQSKGNWVNLSAKLHRHPSSGNSNSTHTVELYKNGALIGTKDVEMNPSTDFGSSSAEIQVGKNFQGTVGQVKTFAKELTAIDMKVTGQPDYIEWKSAMRPVIKSSFEDELFLRERVKAKSIILEVEQDGHIEFDNPLVVHYGEGETITQELAPLSGPQKRWEVTLPQESEISKLELSPTTNYGGSPTQVFKILSKGEGSSVEQAIGVFTIHIRHGSATIVTTVIDFENKDMIIVNNVTGIHGLLLERPNFGEGLENTGPTDARASLEMTFGQSYTFNGSALAAYDMTESFMSAWVKLPSSFPGTLCLFERGDMSVKASVDPDTSELIVTVTLGSSRTYESRLSENVLDEWLSIGAGFSKKEDEVYLYFRTLESTRDDVAAHEDMLSLVAGRLETFSAEGDSSRFDTLNNTSDLTGYVRYYDENGVRMDTGGDLVCVDHLTVTAGNAGPEKGSQFFRHTQIPERKTMDQIDVGAWTHVAATYDGHEGLVRLYHDGEEVLVVKDYVKAEEVSGLSAPLEIASIGGSAITDGVQIADVNSFDYVATPTQIKSMATTMQSSINTTESQRLLYRSIFKIDPSNPTFGTGVGPTQITYAGHEGDINGGVSYDAGAKSLRGFDSGFLHYSDLDLDYSDQPHSISTWVKMDANQSDLGGDYSKIFSFGADKGKNNGVGVFEMNQSDTLWGYFNNTFRWSTSEHEVTAGRWYHYVMTYSGRGTSTDTVKVYVDGNRINISRVQGNDGKRLNLPKRSHLYLGSQYGNGGFAGSMGDMAIFSRELLIGEVLTLHNAGRNQHYPA